MVAINSVFDSNFKKYPMLRKSLAFKIQFRMFGNFPFFSFPTSALKMRTLPLFFVSELHTPGMANTFQIQSAKQHSNLNFV